MTLMERWAYVLAVICYAPLPTTGFQPMLQAQPTHQDPAAQVTPVLSQQLPPLKGDSLKVEVVHVHYAPGESSQPHSHPCPVIGYVLEGAVKMQVQAAGESHPGPVTIYRAGESFYEAANGKHLLSANASQTEPATFLATFVCDHSAPLLTPVSPHEDQHK